MDREQFLRTVFEWVEMDPLMRPHISVNEIKKVFKKVLGRSSIVTFELHSRIQREILRKTAVNRAAARSITIPYGSLTKDERVQETEKIRRAILSKLFERRSEIWIDKAWFYSDVVNETGTAYTDRTVREKLHKRVPMCIEAATFSQPIKQELRGVFARMR